MLRAAVPTHSESVFGAFGSRPGCVVEPFSEGNQIIFTEIMEIRILGKWKSRPATTPDQGDWFIAPRKPESGKRSKARTRLDYIGKARDYEMDFPLTHADRAGAGLYVFTKRRGPG